MNRTRRGFTLVEILIVVIILGILAAIVIPQFTEASNDARKNALLSDLQTARSQLELYKVQHLENYPDSNDANKFVNQMISRTNSAGEIGTDPASYPYGPYLQKFPSNPFVTSNANQVKLGTASCSGDGSTGWYFETDTGKFSPNDSTYYTY
jgi:general secretion pathway protein G